MTTQDFRDAEARADAVPGSWFGAVIYDPLLSWAEKSGMAEHRRRLLASAHGRVLEIGAGTGLNLPHYPDGLESLVLAEPDRHMAKRLEGRLNDADRQGQIVRAPAEMLPFEDDSFDTVVSTLVLCTAEDQRESMEEIRRVLRPGGSLLFLEHVRSEEPGLSRWQDRFHGAWKALADGCNCNLPTVATLREAGFEVTLDERGSWRRMPPIVRPLVSGRASPA